MGYFTSFLQITICLSSERIILIYTSKEIILSHHLQWLPIAPVTLDKIKKKEKGESLTFFLEWLVLKFVI